MSQERKVITVSVGLYVTTRPMPGHEGALPAGRLVRLNRSAEQNLPVLFLPSRQHDNRWDFQERGFIVRDFDYLASLQGRLPEGYYVLRQTVHLSDEQIIPKCTLVQLGYSRGGRPVLYVARFQGSSITFAGAGHRFSDEILQMLEPATFLAPVPQEERHLH